MTAFDVTVYGLPAPQGSKRHVGGGRMVESSKYVAPWREAVKAAVIAARGFKPCMEGPLSVAVVFTLPKPASAAKKAQPYKRPDIDKLLRSTFDALSDCGVWKDDAQVVVIVARKAYPDGHVEALAVPGARISILELAV